MGLDILTPKGQESLADEKILIDFLREKVKDRGYSIVETFKNRAAAVDGFLINANQEVIGVFENKCRYDMDHPLLMDRGSWLITHDKVLNAVAVARALCVPLYGFLRLVPDGSVFQWRIADKEGNILVPLNVRQSRTQKTINGGVAYRDNAYIPLEYAKRLR